MSIYRIGDFQTKAELVEEMLDFLHSIMPIIQSSQGCESVQLYQSQDDPTKFMMIEVWDRVESHRASVKNIPSDLLAQIQPLLASSPSGSYFTLVPEK
jgi:quinol monooxygenase YgiN